MLRLISLFQDQPQFTTNEPGGILFASFLHSCKVEQKFVEINDGTLSFNFQFSPIYLSTYLIHLSQW